MAANAKYTSLPVVALRDEEGGVYLFGVELEGAFFPFGVQKIGNVDERVQLVREAKQAAEQAAPATSSSSSATPETDTGNGTTGGTDPGAGGNEPGTEPAPEQ